MPLPFSLHPLELLANKLFLHQQLLALCALVYLALLSTPQTLSNSANLIQFQWGKWGTLAAGGQRQSLGLDRGTS